MQCLLSEKHFFGFEVWNNELKNRVLDDERMNAWIVFHLILEREEF